MGYRGRDVEVVPLNETQYIVTACDSCSAVGSKELDVVKVTPYIVGKLTSRVSLMEVMAAGASPITISVAISNELYPTGEGILEGVKDELRCIDLSLLPMAISTEKNFTTRQTAVGITVVGICEKSRLRIAVSRPGDMVYILGIPKVGNELNGADDNDIASGRHIKELINTDGIQDIVPIGSKGIMKEVEALACSVNSEFIHDLKQDIDINKSAGPSTCLIFTCSPDCKLPNLNSTPLFCIGRLK